MITPTTEPSVVSHRPSFHLFTPCALVSHPHRSLCCFCQQPWINCTLQLSFLHSSSLFICCFLMLFHVLLQKTQSPVSDLSHSAWKDLCVSSKALLQCYNNGCNGHRDTMNLSSVYCVCWSITARLVDRWETGRPTLKEDCSFYQLMDVING